MSKDKSDITIISTDSNGELIQIGVEHIKTAYIVDGQDAKDLAKKFNVPVVTIEKIIEENSLRELRAAHIKHGLAKLQNVQLGHAEKLMDMETQFKKMRILQLEKTLEDFMAYYSRHGHFYKVHPITNEILKDTNGIPIQIKLPNVSAEIEQLKSAVSMSEGMKQLLSHIDDVIHGNKKDKPIKQDKGIIDLDNFDSLFQKRKVEDDD